MSVCDSLYPGGHGEERACILPRGHDGRHEYGYEEQATPRPATYREIARRCWTSEGWGEPRDEKQERLWVCFFMGNCNPDARYRPRHWTRPGRWIEELVRS